MIRTIDIEKTIREFEKSKQYNFTDDLIDNIKKVRFNDGLARAKEILKFNIKEIPRDEQFNFVSDLINKLE